jgi:choice-of-anchor C domain-containing protein
MKFLGLIAGAALLVGAPSAYAVSITNGDFESTTVGSYATYGPGGSIPGWTIGGDSVDQVGSYWKASSGTQSIDISGNGIGSISQLLTGLSVGQQYTVSFDLSGNPDGTRGIKAVGVFTDGSFDAHGYDHLYTFDTAAAANTAGAAGNMGWIGQTYVFIATAADQTLTFLSRTPGSYGAAIDNVKIAATPIPGAILLFGSALGGLGLLGYRKKKAEAAA